MSELSTKKMKRKGRKRPEIELWSITIAGGDYSFHYASRRTAQPGFALWAEMWPVEDEETIEVKRLKDAAACGTYTFTDDDGSTRPLWEQFERVCAEMERGGKDAECVAWPGEFR